jgi:hypothetical protein
MRKHKNREFTFATQQEETDQKLPSRSTNRYSRFIWQDHDQIEQHGGGQLLHTTIAHESDKHIVKVPQIWDWEERWTKIGTRKPTKSESSLAETWNLSFPSQRIGSKNEFNFDTENQSEGLNSRTVVASNEYECGKWELWDPVAWQRVSATPRRAQPTNADPVGTTKNSRTRTLTLAHRQQPPRHEQKSERDSRSSGPNKSSKFNQVN